jgi:hypothetical protein
VATGLKASAGQAPDVPSQTSATSQSPAACRQTVAVGRRLQVPTLPVRLQAWQPPSHLASQQTPSKQKPLAQSPGAPQATPCGCRQTPLSHVSPCAQSAPSPESQASPTPDLSAQAPARHVCPHSTLPPQGWPSSFPQDPAKQASGPLHWSVAVGSGMGAGEPRPPTQLLASTANWQRPQAASRHFRAVQAASKHSQVPLVHCPLSTQAEPAASFDAQAFPWQ